MSHPYTNLPDYNYWSRSMTSIHPGHIDPIVKSLKINTQEKISTMGSCFAQHLARKIANTGFNYFVPENAPNHMTDEQAFASNYGVFSARYGNVYTVRQALQLFERAFNLKKFEENIWSKDGYVVDAFRPQIQPTGFSTIDSLLEDREKHLESVRKIFTESDWLIFTLGLTEAWRSKTDGAIYPVAPGVSGGSFDPSIHEFINFSILDVLSDLRNLIDQIRSLNKNLKILLTVSPVPLIATYENRHILTSTVASKSILRVAADMMEREFQDVIYFPSYEIITSQASSGRYYADDLREVKQVGVDHVMRMFSKHFLKPEVYNNDISNEFFSVNSRQTIVCDEEVIEQAIRDSGL